MIKHWLIFLLLLLTAFIIKFYTCSSLTMVNVQNSRINVHVGLSAGKQAFQFLPYRACRSREAQCHVQLHSATQGQSQACRLLLEWWHSYHPPVWLVTYSLGDIISVLRSVDIRGYFRMFVENGNNKNKNDGVSIFFDTKIRLPFNSIFCELLEVSLCSFYKYWAAYCVVYQMLDIETKGKNGTESYFSSRPKWITKMRQGS